MTEKVQIPRQESLVLPEVQNPFVHKIEFTVWDYIRIAFMSVTIAPIRLTIAFSLLLLDWIAAKVGFIGRSEDDWLRPMTGWRSNFLRFPVGFLFRCVFFFMGFHLTVTKGKPALPSEALIAVAAPHSSLFDALLFPAMNFPSVVAKLNTGSIPFVGPLVNFLQPVYVKRKDPNSRTNTIKEIKRRSQPNSGWPQIVIFPEGTCTNRSCLISFKGGAFYPGVPVQPIAMNYVTKPDTFTWTWDGPGALALLWLTMCNFHNQLEVEFLPVYKPSQEEIDDPKLFADNVRAVIAKALNLPVTDHTYEDTRLMEKAKVRGIPVAASVIEFQKIHTKLGLKLAHIEEHLDRYVKIAQSEGYITIDDLSQYLNVPISPALTEMFALYDRDQSGKIDFREYVIGCSLVSQPANCEDTLQLAFKMFGGDKGYITSDDLDNILCSAFDMEEMDSQTLFREVDSEGEGRITFDAFKDYAKEKPEYAKLFITYQQLSTERPEPQTNGGHTMETNHNTNKKTD